MLADGRQLLFGKVAKMKRFERGLLRATRRRCGMECLMGTHVYA
jgi:hypothetical protein